MSLIPCCQKTPPLLTTISPGDYPVCSTQICRFCLAFLRYRFPKEASCTPSINWGERDIQLYLLKFTGQAKSCCTICGSGDHFSHGCSLSALRPTSVERGVCNNYNRGLRCSQDPCPFSRRCQTCNGEHPHTGDSVG